MAKEITEEFISGFCKMQNQTRTVICEMEIQEDGSRKLYSSDCAYGACEHSGVRDFWQLHDVQDTL